jgi:flagellar assembly factor FliW
LSAGWRRGRDRAAFELSKGGSGKSRRVGGSDRWLDSPREVQEVNIVTTRFGVVQVQESDLIRIPDGLVGFRNFTQFVHLPDPEVTGLSWLQSVTAAELAFGLVPPPLAVGEYRIELRPGDRAALELDDERSALIYVILNRGDGGGLTVNLQGPLVFNPVRRLGRQLVLTSSRYAVRFPLEGTASAPTLLPVPQALRATA